MSNTGEVIVALQAGKWVATFRGRVPEGGFSAVMPVFLTPQTGLPPRELVRAILEANGSEVISPLIPMVVLAHNKVMASGVVADLWNGHIDVSDFA